MTSAISIVIALSLLLNEFHILCDASILDNQFLGSTLVYLLSVCLLLRRLVIIPKSLWHRKTVSFALETLLSMVLMEVSLFYAWRLIEQYLLLNADDILVVLAEEKGLDWVVCHLCSGEKHCSGVFADLVLKHLRYSLNDLTAIKIRVILNRSRCISMIAVAASEGYPAKMRWFDPEDNSAAVCPRQCECKYMPTPLQHCAGDAQVFSTDALTDGQQIIFMRNRIERTASKRWRGSMRRIISASIYNLSCFTHGCSTGWVSGVLGNEALTGGAWLAALPCLVALPAAPFFAVLADARGRKAGAFCICISFILSWSLAAWCGPRGVWVARVAAGAGGAGALALTPLYCAEIAPSTRGLAAMPALACSSGILFAYAAGGILSAHALSLSMAVPPAVLLVSLFWLPETPSFLISVGRIQDAAKIICWFDGSDFREDLTDVIEQQEVRIRTSDCYAGRREAMRRQESDTFQPMLKRSSGLDSNSEKKKDQSVCRELFRQRRSRRALLSCCIVLAAAAGSGAGAVNSFAAAVLRHSAHAVPHLNLTAYNFTIFNGTAPRPLFEPSEAGSILCGTALVLGAAVATVTVDKLGRKMLLLWSCSGITCCLAILGVYCDPNLHMHAWYSHRLWPYRRAHTFKDKSMQMPEKIQSIDNFTDIIRELKNYSDEMSKPLYRLSLGNQSIEYPHEWSKVQNVTGRLQTESSEALWAPVVLLSIVLFLYNIGLGSVPYVLISELFSINVRSVASSILISWMWLSSFLLLRYYGTLALAVGLHGTYYICASITFLGSLYILFIIPETKGKSQEQIDDALDGPLMVLRKKRKARDQR